MSELLMLQRQETWTLKCWWSWRRRHSEQRWIWWDKMRWILRQQQTPIHWCLRCSCCRVQAPRWHRRRQHPCHVHLLQCQQHLHSSLFLWVKQLDALLTCKIPTVYIIILSLNFLYQRSSAHLQEKRCKQMSRAYANYFCFFIKDQSIKINV